ncbi:hypothetical protein P7C70_g8413, partial [Phenoliferia sp. Uapishka_3]
MPRHKPVFLTFSDIDFRWEWTSKDGRKHGSSLKGSGLSSEEKEAEKINVLLQCLEFLGWTWSDLMHITAASSHPRMSTRLGVFISGSKDGVGSLDRLLSIFSIGKKRRAVVDGLARERVKSLLRKEIVRACEGEELKIRPIEVTGRSLERVLDRGRLEATISRRAPVLWELLMSVVTTPTVWRKRQLAATGVMPEKKRSEVGACIMAFCTLAFNHNQAATILALPTAIELQTNRAGPRAIESASGLSYSTSYTSATVGLRSIGNDQIEVARRFANDPGNQFLMVSDNCNVKINQSSAGNSVTGGEDMMNITNAILLPQRPGNTAQMWDFDAWSALEGQRSNLKIEEIIPTLEDLDARLLETERQWADKLVTHCPGSSNWTHLAAIVHLIDKKRVNIGELPLFAHGPNTTPVRPEDVNEGTSDGAIAGAQLHHTKLKLTEAQVASQIRPVVFDLGAIKMVETGKRDRKDEGTRFATAKWLRGVSAEWHLGMNDLNGMQRMFLLRDLPCPTSLFHAQEKLHRPAIQDKKLDYHGTLSTFRLMSVATILAGTQEHLGYLTPAAMSAWNPTVEDFFETVEAVVAKGATTPAGLAALAGGDDVLALDIFREVEMSILETHLDAVKYENPRRIEQNMKFQQLSFRAAGCWNYCHGIVALFGEYNYECPPGGKEAMESCLFFNEHGIRGHGRGVDHVVEEHNGDCKVSLVLFGFFEFGPSLTFKKLAEYAPVTRIVSKLHEYYACVTGKKEIERGHLTKKMTDNISILWSNLNQYNVHSGSHKRTVQNQRTIVIPEETEEETPAGTPRTRKPPTKPPPLHPVFCPQSRGLILTQSGGGFARSLFLATSNSDSLAHTFVESVASDALLGGAGGDDTEDLAAQNRRILREEQAEELENEFEVTGTVEGQCESEDEDHEMIGALDEVEPQEEGLDFGVEESQTLDIEDQLQAKVDEQIDQVDKEIVSEMDVE